MPIFALFMKDIPDQISIKIDNAEYTLNIALPFKWWVLYFSALFISVAKGVYIAFSPQFIKEFRDYEEFVTSGRKGGFLQKVVFELIPVWKRGKKNSIDDYAEKFHPDIHNLNPIGVKNALTQDIWNSELKPSFWLIHDMANYSRVYPRFICMFFIILSALSFAYITIDKILLVLSII